MPDHFHIHDAEGVWVVRADGAVIAESRAALELGQDGRSPVIYFPREDVAMALLEASGELATPGPMGATRYFDVAGSASTISHAAWAHETPHESLARIAGYLAFDAAKVAVERI